MTICEEISEVAKETWLEYSQKLKNSWIEDFYRSANDIWVLRVTSDLFNGSLQDLKICNCKKATVAFGPKFDTIISLASVNATLVKTNKIVMIQIMDDSLCLALGTEIETELLISFKDCASLSLVF